MTHAVSATKKERASLIISYLAMRRLIGILGAALPILVIVGDLVQTGRILQGSISGYYYSNMRDVFVGILSGVGLFLISYKGYETIDSVVCKVSGVCAFGIIVFPTAMGAGRIMRVGLFLVNDNISEYLHLGFSAVFFLALAFNSMFLFTRRNVGGDVGQKARRNLIYQICGSGMVFTISFLTCYTIFLRHTFFAKSNPVLFLETMASMAFGVSWLVKGNTLFKDKRV